MNKGFTFMEFIFSIVIIGIVSTVCFKVLSDDPTIEDFANTKRWGPTHFLVGDKKAVDKKSCELVEGESETFRVYELTYGPEQKGSIYYKTEPDEDPYWKRGQEIMLLSKQQVQQYKDAANAGLELIELRKQKTNEFFKDEKIETEEELRGVW